MAKEFSGTAINLALVEKDDGTLSALGEFIILVSEPVFTADMTGQIVRQRAMDTLRFTATTKAAREMVRIFTDYISDMEKLEQRASIKPAQETEAA